MNLSKTKMARRAKLDRLSPDARLALYGLALEAWKSDLEQREVDNGTAPAQARLKVKQKHENSLKEGYPAHVKAERDAFVDRHVAAAIA